jgi:hypothetical protein
VCSLIPEEVIMVVEALSRKLKKRRVKKKARKVKAKKKKKTRRTKKL